jgi:hypothetical protein
MASFQYKEQKYGMAVVSDIEANKPIKLFKSGSITVDKKNKDYLAWKKQIDKGDLKKSEAVMKGIAIFVDKKSKSAYVFTKLDKAPYSGGGGSGAGAEVTALAESAVCIVTASLVHFGKVDLTKGGVKKLAGVLDLGKQDSPSEIAKITEWLKKNPDWLDTSKRTAKEIIAQMKVTKKHHFHRDSMFMNNIYGQFQENLKPLNKLGLKVSGDKWNPADIWISSKEKFPAHKDLTTLNKTILTNFKNDNIVGISLKKLGSGITWAVYNLPKSKQLFIFDEVTPPKTPLSSKDTYIVTKSGLRIQIRTFNAGDNIQCELKGENANGGKCGFGATRQIVESISKQKLLTNVDIKKLSEPQIFKLIVKYYKETGYKTDANKLVKEFNDKDFKSPEVQRDFISSKLQSLQIASIIKNHKKRNDMVTGLFGYAHSLGLEGLFEASVYAKIY